MIIPNTLLSTFDVTMPQKVRKDKIVKPQGYIDIGDMMPASYVEYQEFIVATIDDYDIDICYNRGNIKKRAHINQME